MIVRDFADKYYLYENMSIWVAESLEEFFAVHENMYEIFEGEYGFPFHKRAEQVYFHDSDIKIVSKLLGRFSDKHFFVFSDNDKHHKDLIYLHQSKIIDFGMDIENLDPGHIYVLEMDKTKDLRMYDL